MYCIAFCHPSGAPFYFIAFRGLRPLGATSASRSTPTQVAGLPPASVLSPTSWAQISSGFQPDKFQFFEISTQTVGHVWAHGHMRPKDFVENRNISNILEEAPPSARPIPICRSVKAISSNCLSNKKRAGREVKYQRWERSKNGDWFIFLAPPAW